MTAYIVFLIIIILEWLFMFPGAKVKVGQEIACKQRKSFLIIVCIEMICFAGFRAIDIELIRSYIWMHCVITVIFLMITF